MTTMRGTARQGGWFGRPEGHAEAAHRSWEHHRDDDRHRYSSHHDEDDDRRYGSHRGADDRRILAPP